MNQGPYEYGGAEALVDLHANYLREFLKTWRRADEQGLELPATSDPSYGSRELLLVHVMDCAAHYLVWICEQLQLPKPDLERHPEPQNFPPRAESFMESVLAAWELPLREITEEQANARAYESRWGTPYCIDAMLEHAVMHPLRHSNQLERLLASN